MKRWISDTCNCVLIVSDDFKVCEYIEQVCDKHDTLTKDLILTAVLEFNRVQNSVGYVGNTEEEKERNLKEHKIKLMQNNKVSKKNISYEEYINSRGGNI